MEKFMEYTLTEDECEVIRGWLLKMREMKRQEQLRQSCKDVISSQIKKSIDTIGLDETKRIVRELNRELRMGN